jgi:hypothetical protein
MPSARKRSLPGGRQGQRERPARGRATPAGQGPPLQAHANCSAARRPTSCSAAAFATLYLAPWTTTASTAPADARLLEMRYVPGALFSVNAATVRAALPRLFTRNERVACLFETAFGPMAVVLVGALNVGSIETTWAGEVAPGPGRHPAAWRYPQDGPGSVRLARGEELGRFNMGSTVIVVLPEHGPRHCPRDRRRPDRPRRPAARQARPGASVRGRAAPRPARSSTSKRPGSGLSMSSTPKHPPARIAQRHHDLRARRDVAGDVPGKACTSCTSWLRALCDGRAAHAACRRECARRPACPGTDRAPAPRPAGSKSLPS